MPKIEWRANVDGVSKTALYLGDVCVGQICRWSGKEHPHAGEWRAWFNSDEEQPQVGGWYPDGDMARGVVETMLKAALGIL